MNKKNELNSNRSTANVQLSSQHTGHHSNEQFDTYKRLWPILSRRDIMLTLPRDKMSLKGERVEHAKNKTCLQPS